MDNLIKAGKTGKPHGIKGFISVHLNIDVDWDNIQSVFIEINNQQIIPYIIEKVDFFTNKTVVKFKNISDIDAAKKLVNKNIWLEKKYVVSDESDNYLYFSVIDTNKNVTIGNISDWITQGNLEWMIVCTPQNKEVILPFNDELIDKIDEQHKIIYYKAPEGLY